MAFATIQAQLAQLTAQLTHNAERTSMPSVPTLDVPYGQGYQTHQYPQFSANEDVWGYQGYMINQWATCFPTLVIRIGGIIQIKCGMNLNIFNKVDIGSKTSSIQDLCSHHSTPHNNSNRIQVCREIIMKFLKD